MKRLIFAAFIVFLTVAGLAGAGFAANAMIKCRVVDVDGKPVKGAYIFFYDSSDTRRAVDLVSPATDKNGVCRKEIPAGFYWAVARLKKKGDFDMGPLMIGDKVSAEPMEIEVTPGQSLEVEFKIMNLLDTIKVRSKKRKDLNRVSGRIVDENGEPVANVFAFANRYKQPMSMPGYFSAWTGKDGRFLIYLPTGKFYLGAVTKFVPQQSYSAGTEVEVDPGVDNSGILLKVTSNP